MLGLKKIAFDGGGFFVGDSACACNMEGVIESPTVMHAEVVSGCGGWNLNACWNVGIITVPGTYRLRFNDDGAPGIVTIYADIFSVQDLYVPPRLVFGGF